MVRELRPKTHKMFSKGIKHKIIIFLKINLYFTKLFNKQSHILS